MLSRLQQQLNQTYQVGHGYHVRDFLITDPALAKYLGGEALPTGTGETLLVAEQEHDLELSLFLDAELLDRLNSGNPLTRLRKQQLNDFWQVLEGVSHFNCVAWKASRDRTCTLLELELQAEVDKFVTTVQLALAQGSGELSRQIHYWLFEAIEFRSDLDAQQTQRYQAANDYAARYCRGLRERLVHDDRAVLAELRQFFRMQLNDKISHIHRRAWAPTGTR